MTNEEVLQIFSDSGALLTGHFLLSSGLHSSRYLQCALVMQHPATAEKLCSVLAAKAKADERIGQIDLVIAPALGGVVVAHEVARALGVRALFTERQEVMTLRRGFQIAPGEKCRRRCCHYRRLDPRSHGSRQRPRRCRRGCRLIN
jgi:orotate phosphoribosyltransferase